MSLGPLLRLNSLAPPHQISDPRGASHVRSMCRRILHELGSETPEAMADEVNSVPVIEQELMESGLQRWYNLLQCADCPTTWRA